MKVHHVEAAGRYHRGNTAFCGGLEPGRPGAEKTAHYFVRPLGRRHVQHAGDHARFDERFHRPPADPRGVKNQNFAPGLFEDFFRPLHALGCIAEHARHDDGLV